MPNISKTTTPLEHTAALKIMRKAYGRLHDIVADVIESGRLNEGDIPDDFQALVAALVECNNADQAAADALQEKPPEVKPLKNYSVIITRDVTESTFVKVAATGPVQAEELAMEKLSKTTGTQWTVNDGSWDQGSPYATGVDEVTK